MEPNETNMRSTAQEQANVEPAQAQNACGCGGGGKGSNMASVAIWIMLLIGFACVLMFIRSNTGSGNDEALVKRADEYYQKQDFEKMTDCLRQAAEHGYPLAQVYYGGCLKKGVGVAQDAPAAVEYFRKAAEQNNGVAFFELGVCYEDGEGVDRNLDTALEWYRKALDAGIEKAESAILRVEKTKAKTTGAATPSNG